MREIKRDSNAFHLNGKTDAFSPTEIGVAASRSSEGGGNQEFSFLETFSLPCVFVIQMELSREQVAR